MDCSPPGFSVHGILQARILEWVAIPFFCGSFWPRDWTRSPALQVDSLPSELPGKLRFCCDPSVVSKRNFPVEQLPAIKCNPSSMLQVIFNRDREKVWENLLFSGASYYFWIWTWIPFLLKEVTWKGSLHFFPHARNCRKAYFTLFKSHKQQPELQSSLSWEAFPWVLQVWTEGLRSWVSWVASETPL